MSLRGIPCNSSFHALRDLAATDMTMLLVTHQMDFARGFADRVAFLAGELVEQGPPRGFEQPQSERLRVFLRALRE